MNRNPHVAVVGATGAVGIEMIKTLEKRNFPAGKLTLLASARSAGKKLKNRGQDIPVQELAKDSFQGIDLAPVSAGGTLIERFPTTTAKGATLVTSNPDAAPKG